MHLHTRRTMVQMAIHPVISPCMPCIHGPGGGRGGRGCCFHAMQSAVNPIDLWLEIDHQVGKQSQVGECVGQAQTHTMSGENATDMMRLWTPLSTDDSSIWRVPVVTCHTESEPSDPPRHMRSLSEENAIADTWPPDGGVITWSC